MVWMKHLANKLRIYLTDMCLLIFRLFSCQNAGWRISPCVRISEVTLVTMKPTMCFYSYSIPTSGCLYCPTRETRMTMRPTSTSLADYSCKDGPCWWRITFDPLSMPYPTSHLMIIGTHLIDWRLSVFAVATDRFRSSAIRRGSGLPRDHYPYHQYEICQQHWHCTA